MAVLQKFEADGKIRGELLLLVFIFLLKINSSIQPRRVYDLENLLTKNMCLLEVVSTNESNNQKNDSNNSSRYFPKINTKMILTIATGITTIRHLLELATANKYE